MNKYMLTIQHAEQKVAYLEFMAENDEQARRQGEALFSEYASHPNFTPGYARHSSGNFSGPKPRIISHRVSIWIKSETATNAWGSLSGGYWSNLPESEEL